MKVTVTKYLNVRIGKPDQNAPCYNYLAPGSVIEVEENPVVGELYLDSNLWYKGLDGSYYWSGGVTKGPLLPTIEKTSFGWFKQLAIENIWAKYNEKGENVCVAVLDTGYKTSNAELPVIGQHVFINYPNAPACNTIEDRVGHGTRCLSIIGSRNNMQFKIGIAPKSKLLVGKISCRMEMTNPDCILDGIKWAIDNGADIISISFGFIFNTHAEQENYQSKLDKLVSGRKVLIFGSAGNNSNNNNQPMFRENYPASFPQCISVGASHNGAFDNVTLQSDATIIHAPGRLIESYELGELPTQDTGTSFSTPIVAGVVALAVSYVKKKNAGQWQPKEIRNLLYSSATPLSGRKKLLNPTKLFEELTNNYIS